MASIQYYDVIIRPVITEKSMADMGEKKYTFLVHPEANKTQIKEAVEKMFEGTKVKSVNTINSDGKKKRRGMVVGKTAKTKKAIVALTEESKDIEIFEGIKLTDKSEYVHESTRTNSKGETSWESKAITHIHRQEDI